MLAGGKLPPMAVGAKLGVSGQSVYNWAHTWRDQGVIGLLVKIGHKGGRPRALSDEMIAAAVRMASVEPLTREQIVQRLEAEFGSPLPFGHLDTLSVALKREGFTFKRNRLSLKKTRPAGIRRETGHARQAAAGRTRERHSPAISRRGRLLRIAAGSA
ncbi:transposase [Burkholderia sp. HI2714]|nr:transposase [Burkholderia sp. HI2714]